MSNDFTRFHPQRTSQSVRDRIADVKVTMADLIYPYFVVEGTNQRQPIPTLKGIYRFSVDLLLVDLEKTVASGIQKILLFGVVSESVKTPEGTFAHSSQSPVASAIAAIKKKFPSLMVITDVCLCAYTTHGHCGIIDCRGEIENDPTLPELAKMAVAHAQAGADMVAPSAMMDGQVAAIRRALDSEKFDKVKIMGYSAKYASSMYGPFRDAAQSAPAQGNRKQYQMDYRTRHQGIEEVEADIREGADWVMVKPAHTYLDVVARASDRFPQVPLAAYQVSGEYMMLVAAAEKGILNEQDAMLEALTAIKRAGASYIITYYARKFASLTQNLL